ncbi:MAG: NAD(P)-dependent oxidoreductase, partial [Bacteroidota bacterium]|nr:NAD(P)-dependent oxidoreductase [Bacteroidota bacterium]
MIDSETYPSLSNEVSSLPESNHLFPVFLKLEQLSVLLVGGGNVAWEKLNAILVNAPATRIRLVAKEIDDRIHALATGYPHLLLEQKSYTKEVLQNAELVVVAVNDIPLSEQIRSDAKALGLLVNVADKPALCDFYLGSIVQKG